MRVTQGCFSFLPDLTDEQISRAGPILPRQGLGGEHRIHRRSASPQHLSGRCGDCRCSTCATPPA